MESVFLFSEGRCYYQTTKIYCSPCTDQALSMIIADKKYKIKQVDPVNYVSKRKKNIVLRVKKEGIAADACSVIKILDINNNKQGS